MDCILKISNLHVSFDSFAGELKALRGVSLALREGETLAIVGESGSGKSVTSKAIMGLLPKPQSRIIEGTILLNEKNLLSMNEGRLQKIRGKEIAMIFQDPMTSLNPTMIVGQQISEMVKKDGKLSKMEVRRRTLELMELVGIPHPDARLYQYPYQLSGGMRQRIVIAIALACNPRILIADEPTTALDVTVQAQILDLLKDIQGRIKTAIMIITHDFGVVAHIAHRVAVMYAGEIVETGTTSEVFYNPKHPYTWGLLASMPRLHTNARELFSIPGSPPNLVDHLPGCSFAPRCPYRMVVCLHHKPTYTKISDTAAVSCWLGDERAPVVKPPKEAIGG